MDLEIGKISYNIFKNQLHASRVVEGTLEKIYSRLTTAGREIIPGDLKLIIDFLDMVSSAVNSTVINVDEHLLKKIASVVDLTILTEEHVWHQLNKRGEQAATRLVNYLENIVVKSSANITVIIQDTLAIIIAQSEADIHFPMVHEVDVAYNTSWLKKTKNSLYLSHNASQTFNGVLNYSIIIYDGLKTKLMVNQEKQIRHNKELATKTLVSDVISFFIRGFHGELNIPLRVLFYINYTNYRNPVCAFLNFLADESGVWSSDGCHVAYYDQDHVTCECNHTTNFAVLMSPYIEQHKDNYIINTISIICLSVSIICLLATVLVYAVLWRYVKSDRAVLYINLSVTLTLGYVVFLAGINQTQNQVMCTVIAAVLHFLFLVVFFSMLGQGLNVLLSVTRMTSHSIMRYLLPLSYGGPLLIVAITLAVTKAHGYTTDTYCWLSIESGVFWSFSVPALSIILLNFIIVLVVLKAMQTSHFMSNKPLVARTKSVVRSICILSPILGLSWVFGILSMTDPHVIFQYLFAVTNSLQGLLIFICQCLLQQQVRDGARTFIRRYRAVKLDSGHTTGHMI